ncbi:MAG: lysylphosphatidylglycerol synthase domain-containing protein, partial [Planctomycetota bacterium]
SNVLSSMLYNQFSTLALMTVFGLAALMISNPASPATVEAKSRWQLPVICGILLVAMLLLSLLLMSQKAGGRILDVLRNLSRRLPLRMREKRDELFEQIAVFQAVGWRFHLTVASITLVGTLLGGAATYALAARGANITVPMPVMVWLCVVIYVLGRLPISVANLGVRESMLISLLSMYGVDKPAALLMSMILFSALVFMGAIGAMFQIRWASAARKPARVGEQGRSDEAFSRDVKR